MSSPSVPPLSADQVSRFRDNQGRGPQSDVSPGGKYSVEVAAERDRVILTDLASGSATRLPLGVYPEELTVSDQGDVVVGYLELDRETYLASHCLGSLQPDGSVRPLKVTTESWKGPRHAEISGDGKRIAYSDAEVQGPGGSVYVDGPEGHLRSRLPGPVQRNAFLDDGRLLVQTEQTSKSVRIPRYHVVDAAGQVEDLDVATAEALGGPARARLAEAWAASLPGVGAGQCRDLVDLFGYRLPEVASSQERSSLFWAPPGAEGQPFGLYGLEHGQGAPRPALGETDAAALGAQRPGRVEWRPDQRGAAVVYGGTVAVVDLRGESRLLPGTLERAGRGEAGLAWSRDGHWLSAELSQEGGRPGVDVYDSKTGELVHLAPEGRLVGWEQGNVLVQVGSETRSFHVGTLDGEALRDQILGSRPGSAAEIQVESGEVRIGGISLPRREDS